MMEYWKGIAKALVPRRTKDAVAMLFLVPGMTYIGYRVFIPCPPVVTVNQETVYPKEVVRGSYFFLAFDLSWNKSCDVLARRFIIDNAGTEYLAQEDSKSVIANETMQYVVRIPIPLSIPIGPAKVRSDFSYRCDWFEHWIKATTVQGRVRNINIIGEIGMNPPPSKKDLTNF